MKLAFIGGGNMATAIIEGIVKSGFAGTGEISISDKDDLKLKSFKDRGMNVFSDNLEAACDSDIIIVAVKPAVVATVLGELSELKNISDKLIISIAAGVSLAKLSHYMGKEAKFIRVMPNTPAMVGEGMAALCKNSSVSDDEMLLAINMFSTFGKAVCVTEKQMDAVTAVSGSGPAYVYMFIEALADGGVLEGLPRDTAYILAAQTVLGAAKMVLETGIHPGTLKDMVCSPGGTTIEAVASLENDGFRGSIIRAVEVCAEKSSKL